MDPGARGDHLRCLSRRSRDAGMLSRPKKTSRDSPAPAACRPWSGPPPGPPAERRSPGGSGVPGVQEQADHRRVGRPLALDHATARKPQGQRAVLQGRQVSACRTRSTRQRTPSACSRPGGTPEGARRTGRRPVSGFRRSAARSAQGPAVFQDGVGAAAGPGFDQPFALQGRQDRSAGGGGRLPGGPARSRSLGRRRPAICGPAADGVLDTLRRGMSSNGRHGVLTGCLGLCIIPQKPISQMVLIGQEDGEEFMDTVQRVVVLPQEPIGHDQPLPARAFRRASGRTGLSRRLCRRGQPHPQHRRHPQRRRRGAEAAGHPRPALARRLLRGHLPLARRHRPAREAARCASMSTGAWPRSRTSSGRTSSWRSAAPSARSRTSRPISAPPRRRRRATGSNTATSPANPPWPTSAAPTAQRSRSASATGASATRTGAAAAT